MANDFLDEDISLPNEDYSGALDIFNRAVNEGTIDELILSENELVFVIDFCIDNDELDNALIACELAYSRFSYNSDILFRYIDLLIILRRGSEALSLIDENKSSLSFFPEINLLYARAFLCLGKLEEARMAVSEFEKKDYTSTELKETFCALAGECMDTENFNEALFYYRKAEKYGSLDNDNLSDMAFCYDYVGDFDKALELYEYYLDADPFSDMIWYNVGTMYARKEFLDKAVEAFEYAIALNRENYSALHNLAVASLSLGRYEKALEYFKECTQHVKGDVVCYLGTADALFALGRFDEAKGYLKKALEIEPSNPEAEIGLTCVDLVADYANGKRAGFPDKIIEIAKADIGWAVALCKAFPELQANSQIKNFLNLK